MCVKEFSEQSFSVFEETSLATAHAKVKPKSLRSMIFMWLQHVRGPLLGGSARERDRETEMQLPPSINEQ